MQKKAAPIKQTDLLWETGAPRPPDGSTAGFMKTRVVPGSGSSWLEAGNSTLPQRKWRHSAPDSLQSENAGDFFSHVSNSQIYSESKPGKTFEPFPNFAANVPMTKIKVNYIPPKNNNNSKAEYGKILQSLQLFFHHHV